MNLVLITSMLYVPNHLSIYSKEERLEQTINSIKSVKERISNVYIVILEGSKISHDDKDCFINAGVNYIHQVNINNLPKSVGELCLISTYLLSVEFKNINTPGNIEVIHKLSGRYVLCNPFDINIVPSTHSIIKTYNDVYDTRYYRFNIINLEQFLEIISIIFKNHLFLAGIMDVEHAFYKYNILPKDTLFHPKRIGVRGNIAPTGEEIYD